MKYLDGVTFLINKIEALCQESSMKYEIGFKAEEEGYYAGHIDLETEFEIPSLRFDTETFVGGVEIQITTQVQEVIRRLLHKYYEEQRLKLNVDEPMWQWNYQSDEFSAYYLGHILHYVEGMIMEIRDKQEEDINNESST